MSQTVWLVRHGNRQDFVDPNWVTKADRPFDPGLSEDGVQQAKELAQRLVGRGISRLLVSPFLRTVQTSHYCAEALNLPVHLEWGVCEWLHPDWFSGMPKLLKYEELIPDYPHISKDYQSRFIPDFPEPSEQEILVRSGIAIKKLVDEFSEDLLIISHALTVVGMAGGLIGEIPNMSCGLCSITKMVHENSRWLMEWEADTTHLSNKGRQFRFRWN